jgi:hypothetical protein
MAKYIVCMNRGFLEDCLARGMSLERIGGLVGKHPSTVGYWLSRHGLTATGASRFSARGAIDRKALTAAVEAGRTLKEMAEAFDRDISTVRYWLKRYGIRASGGARRRQAREARRLGLRHINRRCSRHGMTRFLLDNRGVYRCMRCRGEDVSAWRRRAKRRLVEEAGGRCQICGYDRYMGALQFHHVDPSRKSFLLSMRGCTRSIEKLRAEAAKCQLLCANCHAEVEAGLAQVEG